MFAATSAQDKKEKKNKKKDQPKLTVVEVQEAPIVVPVVVPQKPANGSLFTDNSIMEIFCATLKPGRLAIWFLSMSSKKARQPSNRARREIAIREVLPESCRFSMLFR